MAQPKPSHDPTVYPVEEKMGEDTLQRDIAELLRPLIRRYLQQRGVEAFVGADQFVYLRQFEPTRRLSPDLYVLPGVKPRARISSWKVWEHGGLSPSLCIEVVSRDWQKDYLDNPPLYDELGVRELVVFDPDFDTRRGGIQLQVFRRIKGRGLRRVEATDGDRVASRVLGCFLRVVEGESGRLLRLGVGPSGDELFPTEAEAERQAKEAERQAKETERQAREAERQAREAERQAREAERQAREAAEARVRELERRLAELGGKPPKGKTRPGQKD